MTSQTRQTRHALRSLAAVVTGVLAVIMATPAAAAIPDAGAPPSSMTALGDSITRGYNACGFYVDCTYRSFATGSDSTVNSHYRRILRLNWAMYGHAYNDARTGATSADLGGQAATAVSRHVGYVTVLIGANDACTSTESGMTPVDTYRARIDAALATLRAGIPDARVNVSSIPDVKRLWEVGKGSSSARSAWATFGICQSLLARPTSTLQADVDRRLRVEQRVADYNTALAQSCAAYGSHCRYDGGAVFGYPFALSQISTWDYFHPNAAGQQALAATTYAAGFAW